MTITSFTVIAVLAALGTVALVAMNHFIQNAQQMFADSRFNESAAKFRRAF